jgi:hypothetical protein
MNTTTTTAPASLIAAAPELLEACRAAADIQHQYHRTFGEKACTPFTPCLFCSTIAEAEGHFCDKCGKGNVNHAMSSWCPSCASDLPS